MVIYGTSYVGYTKHKLHPSVGATKTQISIYSPTQTPAPLLSLGLTGPTKTLQEAEQ